ncbi:MAG: hypothetical protein ACOZNI_08830 [Myxococcota bacterium]
MTRDPRRAILEDAVNGHAAWLAARVSVPNLSAAQVTSAIRTPPAGKAGARETLAGMGVTLPRSKRPKGPTGRRSLPGRTRLPAAGLGAKSLPGVAPAAGSVVRKSIRLPGAGRKTIDGTSSGGCDCYNPYPAGSPCGSNKNDQTRSEITLTECGDGSGDCCAEDVECTDYSGCCPSGEDYGHVRAITMCMGSGLPTGENWTATYVYNQGLDACDEVVGCEGGTATGVGYASSTCDREATELHNTTTKDIQLPNCSELPEEDDSQWWDDLLSDGGEDGSEEGGGEEMDPGDGPTRHDAPDVENIGDPTSSQEGDSTDVTDRWSPGDERFDFEQYAEFPRGFVINLSADAVLVWSDGSDPNTITDGIYLLVNPGSYSPSNVDVDNVQDGSGDWWKVINPFIPAVVLPNGTITGPVCPIVRVGARCFDT